MTPRGVVEEWMRRFNAAVGELDPIRRQAQAEAASLTRPRLPRLALPPWVSGRSRGRPDCQGRPHLLEFKQPAGLAMKLSARNILRGKIIEVVRGPVTSQVRIDIDGCVITSSLTSEAVDELGLKPGAAASAVIKSSDVILAVD